MKRFLRLVAAAVFLGLCLLAILVPLIAISIPERALQLFGPPSAGLSERQRWTYSLLLVMHETALTRAADEAAAEQDFEIALGESASSVAQRLVEQKLISNAEAFRNYLVYTGLDKQLQAGRYTLSAAQTPVQIARSMLDPTPKQVDFRILAGWRLEEIAAALPTSGLNISPEVFLAAARTPPPNFPFLTSPLPSSGLEGFLYPDGYTLPRSLSASELIQILLERFEQEMSVEIQQGLNRQGLTVFQGIILASIVEREAIDESEMPLIASVFHNRLSQGMKLDSDPTVQYAIGFNSEQRTWWTNPLSLQDLKIDSAYNTYLYSGLPPGPISNPGVAAWRAVAFPADSPYLYFRAACDGSGRHNFARTFEEHLANGCP
jgi:UPF0755 protein